MKNLRFISAVAAACALFASQPALAAEMPFDTYGSAVITAGKGAAQGGGAEAPGQGTETVHFYGPGGQAGGAGETTGTVENVQAPAPESSGSASSPVITAGGTENQEPVLQASQEPAAGTEQGGAESPAGVPSGELFPADQSTAQAEKAGAEQAASSGRVVDPSKPMVALTFDDGPQPSVGNRIMDCLAQYGGKATFFMVGERVGSYASEVQRMVAEGHEVANHSMNHKYFQKLGPAQIQAQVSQANDAIEAACGVRPKLMRLPGGNVNNTVKANVNMPMIQWNIDTLDWKTKNADKTVQAVLSKVKDGDIVLMHELYSQSGDAAVRMIPELVNRGFQLVTVSEMAAAKGKTLEPGKLYSSMP